MQKTLSSIQYCFIPPRAISVVLLGLAIFFCFTSWASAATLRWDANSESDLAGYILYYKTGVSGAPYDGSGLTQGNSGVQLPVENLLNPLEPEFTLSGFEPGQTYYFTVTAYDRAGNESGYSNEEKYDSPATGSFYSINATCSLNGSIAPSGVSVVSPGTAMEFQISPDPGFYVEDVTVDGVSVGPVSSYSFTNIDADHAIHARFASIPTMTIISTSAPNGTISPSGEVEATRGSNKTYTMSPNPGHHIVDILVDGVSVGVVGTYTFENITNPHSIHAVFGIDTFSVTSSFEGTGSISPSGTVALTRGSDQTYIMTADAGHHIADVLVDGAAGSYVLENITGPHTIHAVFAVNMFAVAAGSEGSGSISPSGSLQLEFGSTQTYTIAADTGHHIADVLVDGISVGAVGTYTFESIAVSHTIHAVFGIDTFSVTSSAEAGGTITPFGLQEVNYGSNQTYTITADAGHHIADVMVDGVSVGAVGSYTVRNITEPRTIHAMFAVDTFTVAASSEGSGTITPPGTLEPEFGSNQTYTITADTGHHVADVRVDGASVGAAGSYTFERISGSHTIHAVFAVDTFTISAGSEGNGTISPSGFVEVPYGSSQVFTISPDQGYTVDAVRVDGVPIGDAATYTFTDVTGDHQIHAQFVMEPRAPIADAGPDQTVNERTHVQLNASNSIDFDDGIERFRWEQVGGVPVEISSNGPNAPEAAFTAPDVGEDGESLVFRVTVTDYSGKTGTDECIVNVSLVNMPPLADAGETQTVAEGSLVALDGSESHDPDDGVSSYFWSQIEGVPVTLSNPNIENPTFLAPDVLSESVSLKFRLEVSDTGGLISRDVCTVNVSWENDPPQADAGEDLIVTGGMVVLDGSGSMDRDDGIAQYRWKQLTGPPVVLSDTTAAAPGFTAPVVEEDHTISFMLTVMDSAGLQDSDTCQVLISGSVPAPQETYEIIIDFTNKTGAWKKLGHSAEFDIGDSGQRIRVTSWGKDADIGNAEPMDVTVTNKKGLGVADGKAQSSIGTGGNKYTEWLIFELPDPGWNFRSIELANVQLERKIAGDIKKLGPVKIALYNPAPVAVVAGANSGVNTTIEIDPAYILENGNVVELMDYESSGNPGLLIGSSLWTVDGYAAPQPGFFVIGITVAKNP